MTGDSNSTVHIYRPDQPVLVWQRGAWRPGLVLAATVQAVMVRYRVGDQEGTSVDTVTPDKIRRNTTPAGLSSASAAPTSFRSP